MFKITAEYPNAEYDDFREYVDNIIKMFHVKDNATLEVHKSHAHGIQYIIVVTEVDYDDNVLVSTFIVYTDDSICYSHSIAL